MKSNNRTVEEAQGGDAIPARAPLEAAGRRVFLAGLVIALMTTVLYGGAAFEAGRGRFCAPPQPDSCLFFQYARALAEGHPYHYLAEDPASTGNTSHLYPAAISLLYFLGARGDAFPTASFLFSAACYLAFVTLFFFNARMLLAEHRSAAYLAFFLCVFSGQSAFAALGQTDMGLFMALVQGVLFCALSSRTRALGVLLFLAALCRPEGGILALLFAGMGLVGRTNRRRFLGAGLAGVAGLVCTLALNRILTGEIAFQSLAHKGYWGAWSPAGALTLGLRDLSVLVREVFFGIARNGREHYLLPVAGGLFFLLGLMARPWRKDSQRAWVEGVFLAAMAGACVLLASSGWQGFVFDRHLAWAIPLVFFYVAAGLFHLAARFPFRRAFEVGAAVFLLYQITGAAFFYAQYVQAAQRVMSRILFAEDVHTRLPKQATLGGVGGAIGFAYFMPGRPVANVHGIGSPQFFNHLSVRSGIELLAHRPALRFDYWLIRREMNNKPWIRPFLGKLVSEQTDSLQDPFAFMLRKADWSGIERGADPLDPEIQKRLEGWNRVGRLDIGYPPDEKAGAYSTAVRINGLHTEIFITQGEIGGREIVEAGRAIIGSDAFTVPTAPGKGLRIVLRTAVSAATEARLHSQLAGVNTFSMANPLGLAIFVDGHAQPPASFKLNSEGFTEILLDIPGRLITGARSRIRIAGDHLALAYWFYQPR